MNKKLNAVSFRDKMTRSIQRQKEDKTRGHLNLPKNVKAFVIEEDSQMIELDFLMYTVSDPHHPERDPQYEIALPGTQWYRRPYALHRDVGPQKEAIVCPRSIGKSKCPICEYREKRKAEKADNEEIKMLYPKGRSLYVVVPLGMKKFSEVPHIWDMSDFLFQETLNDELQLYPEHGDFPNLDGGKTLSMRLKWKQIGTNSFPEIRSISFSEREPYPESVIEEIPNLDEVLRIIPYEEIERKFFAMGDDADDATTEEISEVDSVAAQRRIAAHREEEEPAGPAPTRARRDRGVQQPATSERAPVRQSEGVKTEGSRRERPPVAAEDAGQVCPIGLTFGKDFEADKRCEDCDLWNDCYDAYKKMK